MKPTLLAVAAWLSATLAAPAWAQGPTLVPAPGQAPPPAVAPASVQTAAVAMPPDTVLADNGIVRVTRADYDLELTKLPPDIRGGFATTERRVLDLITKLLVTKTLAAQADSSGLMRDPIEAARLAAEIERYKAQVVIQQMDAESAKRFDANLPAWEARAKDVYAMDPARWTQQEQIAVWHILYRPDKRGGPEGAMKAAQDARAKILAGADFSRIARDADDPAAARSAGYIGLMSRGTLDPEFEKVAFSLAPGQLSEPVVTPFGVHLIRVESRVDARKLSFDQAKRDILAELKQKYVASEREAALGGMQEKARASADMALVDRMVIRVDPGVVDLDRAQREALRSRGSRPAN